MSTSRMIGALVASFALVPVLGVGSALAASPEQQCAAMGGTFDRSNGTAICTLPVESDPVGSSPEGGPQQTRDMQETQTGQGNLNNKDKDTTCTAGPGNQSSC